MTGNKVSQKQPKKAGRFLLDECLPFQVAESLAVVGYPITNHRKENLVGKKDPEVLAWLESHDCVWITKDANARKAHWQDITKRQVSVVWIRGLDRADQKVTLQALHLMLTVKLGEIQAKLAQARGPRHFTIHLAGERPVLRRLEV